MGFLVGSHSPGRESGLRSTDPRKIGSREGRAGISRIGQRIATSTAAAALLLGADLAKDQRRPNPNLIVLVNLEVHPVPVCGNGILRLLKSHSPCAYLVVKIVLNCILLPGARTGAIGLWP
jgi:hypothetical protein